MKFSTKIEFFESDLRFVVYVMLEFGSSKKWSLLLLCFLGMKVTSGGLASIMVS